MGGKSCPRNFLQLEKFIFSTKGKNFKISFLPKSSMMWKREVKLKKIILIFQRVHDLFSRYRFSKLERKLCLDNHTEQKSGKKIKRFRSFQIQYCLTQMNVNRIIVCCNCLHSWYTLFSKPLFLVSWTFAMVKKNY